jgi:mannose-6-phosphate isomerase class I
MKREVNRAYKIVSTLIPQPTWGGKYIANFKNISDKKALGLKIGQSYELYSNSDLTLDTSPTIQYEINDHPYDKKKYSKDLFSLQELVNSDPLSVLGRIAFKKVGKTFQTLVKFTQAKGNSFQVHVKKREEFKKWKAKPESWYFFEKGLATLGVRPNVSKKEYLSTCITINDFILKQSRQIHDNKITISLAKKEIQSFIKKYSPYTFVQKVHVPKHAVIDLSKGGIHHSWEENAAYYPHGNIVYEVQLDIPDDKCTIRSFDKGKVDSMGNPRNVHIEDYFKAIDVDKKNNNLVQLIKKPTLIKRTSNYSISSLFNTYYYSTDEIVFSTVLEGETVSNNSTSYQHIFIKKGTVYYHDSSVHLTLNQGDSIFIPAIVQYSLRPIHKNAIILRTQTL